MASTHPGTFNMERAERVLRFASTLRHPTDTGIKNLTLFPFQTEIIRELYGRNHPEDETQRAYRQGFLGLPRRSGKSFVTSVLALSELCASVRGAQVVVCAPTLANGGVIFKFLEDIIAATPHLAGRLHPIRYRKRIEDPITGSTLQVLTSEAKTQFGQSISFAIFDEWWAFPDESMRQMVMSSTASRKSSLVVYITTAGFDTSSYPYTVWQYAQNVQDGIIADPHFYSRIYSAPPETRYDDIDAIIATNPAIQNGFKNLDDIKARVLEAHTRPETQREIEILHLNKWVTPNDTYLPMTDWLQCATYDPAETDGLTWYGALDLGVSDDWSAATFVCELPDGRLAVDCRFWVPEKSKQTHRLRPWSAWEAAGAVILTPGPVTDYSRIEADLLDILKSRTVESLSYDRAYASALMQRLDTHIAEEGLSTLLVDQPQGFKLTLGAKTMKELVQAHRLAHNGQPVLQWMASYAYAEHGTIGGIRFVKKKSKNKIDGIVSLCMSTQRWALVSSQPVEHDDTVPFLAMVV